MAPAIYPRRCETQKQQEVRSAWRSGSAGLATSYESNQRQRSRSHVQRAAFRGASCGRRESAWQRVSLGLFVMLFVRFVP